jgi:methionyl-tRNA formyltransferase
VVVAYSQILPKEIIEIPRLGTIGVHPSLLPKYRGATPIQNAILSGEKETGVSVFLIDEKVDHGSLVSSVRYQVSRNETYETLMQKLAELAGDLLIKTLPKFAAGEVMPKPQNEAEATYTKKFMTQDAFVNLKKDDPAMIERKIRALNPEPGVWTLQDSKRIKILEAEIIDGRIKLRKIQEAGKKPKEV